jgi:hypothetical protein
MAAAGGAGVGWAKAIEVVMAKLSVLFLTA